MDLRVALPAELLRTIFESASTNDTPTALALCSVSSWVRQWVEPLLFRVINLFEESSYQNRVLRHKSPAFLSQHVTHLALSEALLRTPEIDRVAHAFAGVTDLYAYSYTNNDALWPPHLAPTRITLWCVDNRLHATDPIFRNVTHLDCGLRLAGWTRIAEYSRAMEATLTHLSLRAQHVGWERCDVDAIADILASDSLRVLLIVANTTELEDDYEIIELARHSDVGIAKGDIRVDHRLVFMIESEEAGDRKGSLSRWVRDAWGDHGRFETADDIVSRRHESGRREL